MDFRHPVYHKSLELVSSVQYCIMGEEWWASRIVVVEGMMLAMHEMCGHGSESSINT